MDDLLHDYFKAETPNPWPSFQEPATITQPKPAATLWSRFSARVTLAACVALLIAGYLTLGAFFPRTQAPSGVQDLHRDMSQRDKGPRPIPAKPQPANPSDDPTPMVP